MKKRILFVEDDPILLQMYAAMMDDAPDQWEVETAGDGRQALQLMARAPFDVVVSDLFMPGMDGIELINEVRTRHPRTSRIILSVMSNQEKVARCLNATHQFIAKPFDVEVFRATLDRICGLDAYLRDDKAQSARRSARHAPQFSRSLRRDHGRASFPELFPGQHRRDHRPGSAA